MARTGDGSYPPANPASRSKKKRSSEHDDDQQRSSKKKKRVTTISQTETETLNYTSTSYTQTYSNSYTYSNKEKRHKGKSKWAHAEDKRKWINSTRIVSPNQVAGVWVSFCVPRTTNSTGFTLHATSHQHKYLITLSTKDRVVFMSYNILGVKNAAEHEHLYPNVSPKHLDWDYRKRLIHKEIREYNPGIMCFQEVDCYDDLDHLLQKEGFTGVYQGRTGDACDGCAIFWNREIFELLHEESIEFRKFDLRDNVCQLCVFKMNVENSRKDTGASVSESVSSRSFVVGNTHVLFNPNRGDIKLGQVRLFLESAQRISLEWGDIPVVLAGDLNSMPQSAIYQFFSSSKLDIQMHERNKISGQIVPSQYRSFKSSFSYGWSAEELRLATGTGASHLIHQLQLRSAYAGVPGSYRTRDNSGEPLATSYHSKFMGTVDYIWHTTEFVPVRVLDTLPIDILTRTGGLPSKKWGSDHLALVCELAFTDEDS